MSRTKSYAAPTPHLPDPSVWPLVAGLATFVAAGALVWWSRDRSGALIGVFLGVGVTALLLTVAGWTWQDSRMRRMAAAAEHGRGVNQVIEFLVNPGSAAVTALLADIEKLGHELQANTDLQDVRILQSARDGQAMVMVEAAWPSMDALNAADTRQSFLDVISRYPGAVQQGTVQAFDLESVVDTKDLSPSFNIVAAATIVGAIVLGVVTGGFGMVLFNGSGNGGQVGPGPGRTPTAVAAFAGVIEARQIRFIQTEFSLPPDTEVTLKMDNQDKGIPHNIAFYNSETPGEGGYLGGCISGCDDDEAALRTKIENGLVVQTFTFKTPPPGRYGYLCEVHPTTMLGVVEIVEGAPVPVLAP